MDDAKKVKYLNINGSIYCPGPSKTSELSNDASFVDASSMVSYVESEVQPISSSELDDILKSE